MTIFQIIWTAIIGGFVILFAVIQHKVQKMTDEEIINPQIEEKELYESTEFDELSDIALKHIVVHEDLPHVSIALEILKNDYHKVIHGHWEKICNAYGELEGFIHIECGRQSKEASKYCPACGTKMDEET